ncbi:MAG: hypothetical protein C3F14_07315 [Deltaproteobacteria bacterium]|nr:MAG: hypothetical protein C3F14_07315 [Deltaproteobacteria bacterium]
MRGTLLRSTGQSVIAILCIASFLVMSLGAVSRAFAGDSWETWPRKPAGPGIEQIPATDSSEAAKDWETWPKKSAKPDMEQEWATDAKGAANAGEAPGRKKAKGYGTIAWIALGVAAAIGIALAAGGGGDNGGGVVTNPGHH